MLRRFLVATLATVCLACPDDPAAGGDCPPPKEKLGVYCFDPIDPLDAGPSDQGSMDARDVGPMEDTGTPDTGVPLPDAGPPPDIGPLDASVVMPGAAGRILLRGTAVLTMAADEFTPGEIYTENGLIACVGGPGDCTAMAAGATIIDTGAVILPGLVDPHNHLAFNWLPEWTPGQLWNDHTHWQGSAAYDTYIEPYSANRNDTPRFCAMVQWGEIRSLLSGTTTAMGAPQARTCFRWLVRNPELATGYNGWDADLMRTNTLGIGQLDQTGADELIIDMDNGDVTAYMIHLGEGISVRAHDEYDDLVMFNLLREETTIIHGTALTATDLEMVAAANVPVVWSPSSNMVLYGETLDIPAALSAGVSLSLSADWTPSGADDLLHEVRFARLLVDQRWPGSFTDREYVEMITRRPAEHMAIDQYVGTLEVGKFADVLVIAGDASAPYNTVIEARPQQIRLVLLDGQPSYGEAAIMQSMIDRPPSCHDFDVCGATLTACWDDTPAGPVSPESIATVIEGFYPSGPSPLVDCQ